MISDLNSDAIRMIELISGLATHRIHNNKWINILTWIWLVTYNICRIDLNVLNVIPGQRRRPAFAASYSIWSCDAAMANVNCCFKRQRNNHRWKNAPLGNIRKCLSACELSSEIYRFKSTQTRWWNVGVRRSAKAHDGTLIDAISGSEETVQYSGENDNNSLVSHGCNPGTTAQPRRIQNATHIAMPYNPVRLQTASQRASEPASEFERVKTHGLGADGYISFANDGNEKYVKCCHSSKE